MIETLPPRIRGRIFIDPMTGCWRWTGALDSDGYGNVRIPVAERAAAGQTWMKAHRYVYTFLAPALVLPPLPKGDDLDHLCHLRGCVRPTCFEVVSRRVNLVRMHWFKKLLRGDPSLRALLLDYQEGLPLSVLSERHAMDPVHILGHLRQHRWRLVADCT